MEVKKVSPEEYENIFPNPYHVFNRVDFNLLNAGKRKIPMECWAFKTKKYKLGIIGGIIENKFVSPFSAPFGGPECIKDISLETLEQSVDHLIDYTKSQNLEGIELTLPPPFYSTSFISKMNYAFSRKGFSVSKNDINHSIHLEDSVDKYLQSLDTNARKHLNIALTKHFVFRKCQTGEEKVLAYEVIKKNREAKGYPLRMTYDDICDTVSLIAIDFFLVYLEGSAVAAAIVFHVSKTIVQVVYWGDLVEYTENKSMNYLSYNIVNYYHNSQTRIIDIGPSTDNGIPNYGLCAFKESIGSLIFSKLSWKISL